jgi:hypothetical protein
MQDRPAEMVKARGEGSTGILEAVKHEVLEGRDPDVARVGDRSTVMKKSGSSMQGASVSSRVQLGPCLKFVFLQRPDVQEHT